MHKMFFIQLFCFVLSIALATLAHAQSLTLQAENGQPKGWGAGGWGTYRLVVKNNTDQPVQLASWSAHWEVHGRTFGDSWDHAVNQTLAAGQTATLEDQGVLPVEVAAAARPGAGEIVGTFTVKQGDKVTNLAFRIPVPEAKLPEPLKEVDGKTVGMALMQSRYRTFHHLDRTLRWLDQCYAAMIDLTGEKPFNGKRMIYKEAPAHPWWAYAGQEMVLNTDYVGSTLKDFDDGLIAFGWVHEVGHNFDDQLGKWYIWSGPAAEWQANFKLCYALETIPDQSFRIRWTFQAPGYPAPDANIRLTGDQLVERFFLMFGDQYLGDPSRKWDTLSSDEMHTFFQRIQRVYGWDVFKRWYRTYRRLENAGMKPPETAEDKISLIAAILSTETKCDLTPTFQRWRFPVTPESVHKMKEHYHIGKP